MNISPTSKSCGLVGRDGPGNRPPGIPGRHRGRLRDCSPDATPGRHRRQDGPPLGGALSTPEKASC